MPQNAVRAAGRSEDRSMLSGSVAAPSVKLSGIKRQRQRQSRAFHLPVTFDSSQISRISTITMQVPVSGMPTTTPTPQSDAAYPKVAGASRPPTRAKEKIPLKNPGW
jgi:hypothetical protein